MIRTVCRAFDTPISVEADDPRLERIARAIVASCPPTSAPVEVAWRLEAAGLNAYRDDELLLGGLASIGEVAAVFERDLYDVVVERVERSFLVHGAVLTHAERAVLLFGPSGAGKTTMTRALVSRGARYVTDEFAAIDPEGRARGLPRALSKLPSSPPFDPEAVNLRGHGEFYEFMGRNGEVVHNDLFALAPELVTHDSVPMGAVVQMIHDPTASPGITELRAAEMLPMLWDERHRGGEEELEIAIRLLERVPAFRLVTRSVERACADLEGVFPFRR